MSAYFLNYRFVGFSQDDLKTDRIAISMTRFFEALRDGASGLEVMYALQDDLTTCLCRRTISVHNPAVLYEHCCHYGCKECMKNPSPANIPICDTCTAGSPLKSHMILNTPHMHMIELVNGFVEMMEATLPEDRRRPPSPPRPTVHVPTRAPAPSRARAPAPAPARARARASAGAGGGGAGDGGGVRPSPMARTPPSAPSAPADSTFSDAQITQIMSMLQGLGVGGGGHSTGNVEQIDDESDES